jgi:putative FmdB family regulatory protein
VPIYEYRCPNGHTFEVFQKMSDAPVETCSSCGAGPVQKLLFPVAVHFKGSGFYSTDYGKGRKRAKEAGETGTGSSTDKADKSASEKSSGDKGSGDKGSGDKSSGDGGSGGKKPAS